MFWSSITVHVFIHFQRLVFDPRKLCNRPSRIPLELSGSLNYRSDRTPPSPRMSGGGDAINSIILAEQASSVTWLGSVRTKPAGLSTPAIPVHPYFLINANKDSAIPKMHSHHSCIRKMFPLLVNKLYPNADKPDKYNIVLHYLAWCLICCFFTALYLHLTCIKRHPVYNLIGNRIPFPWSVVWQMVRCLLTTVM